MENPDLFRDQVNDVALLKYKISQQHNKKISNFSKAFRLASNYSGQLFKKCYLNIGFGTLKFDKDLNYLYAALKMLNKTEYIDSTLQARGISIKIDESDEEFFNKKIDEKKLKKLEKFWTREFNKELPSSKKDILLVCLESAITEQISIDEINETIDSITNKTVIECEIEKNIFNKSVSLMLKNIKSGEEKAKESFNDLVDKHNSLVSAIVPHILEV